MQWVRLSKYCELSGETRNTVNHKKKAGLWLEGREYRVAGDGCLWINLDAVNHWAGGGGLRSKRR
ncbi:excisionase [Sansalvadorimonas verongulae]|nr:excisionase [Sansalvadorimonas verongulae]